MHALAGTIGHELILDEEARQAAKQASRTRQFERTSDRPGLIPVRVETIFGGKSTPSTAASPPHDAEAAREVERLAAARLLAAAGRRALADGADLRRGMSDHQYGPVAGEYVTAAGVPVPAGETCQRCGVLRLGAPATLEARALDALTRVRKVLDGLEHQSRQYAAQASDYSEGLSAGIRLAVSEVTGALR